MGQSYLIYFCLRPEIFTWIKFFHVAWSRLVLNYYQCLDSNVKLKQLYVIFWFNSTTLLSNSNAVQKLAFSIKFWVVHNPCIDTSYKFPCNHELQFKWSVANGAIVNTLWESCYNNLRTRQWQSCRCYIEFSALRNVDMSHVKAPSVLIPQCVRLSAGK